MAATTRPLPSGVPAAITARLTRPFKLVRMEFPAPYGVKCYSTGPVVLFNGENYLPDLCEVGELTWNGDGEQEGKVELYNDDSNSASLMILQAGISEVPVEVFDCYHLLNGDTTPPILTAKGTLTDSDIEPMSVILTMTAVGEQAEIIPNRYVTRSAGFNWLPKPGSSIKWGTETYIFEEDK